MNPSENSKKKQKKGDNEYSTLPGSSKNGTNIPKSGIYKKKKK